VLPTSGTARFQLAAQSMHAYAVQPSAGLIKLDAMENPFRLPPALQASWASGWARGDQPLPRAARRRPAWPRWPKHADLPAGCELMLGNGSDELIAAVGGLRRARRHHAGAAAGLRDVRDVGAAAGPALRRRAADGGLRARRAAMLAAIEQHRPALTYIAYPNNPTANLWDDAVIERIVAAVGASTAWW
jgi:histidinol-phosphate aminotransferase